MCRCLGRCSPGRCRWFATSCAATTCRSGRRGCPPYRSLTLRTSATRTTTGRATRRTRSITSNWPTSSPLPRTPSSGLRGACRRTSSDSTISWAAAQGAAGSARERWRVHCTLVAGRIRDEDIAAVRERAKIEDIVGEYVTLRGAGGGSLKGLCPFHDEKTPSFHVTPARGLWHCFGACGEGGDV